MLRKSHYKEHPEVIKSQWILFMGEFKELSFLWAGWGAFVGRLGQNFLGFSKMLRGAEIFEVQEGAQFWGFEVSGYEREGQFFLRCAKGGKYVDDGLSDGTLPLKKDSPLIGWLLQFFQSIPLNLILRTLTWLLDPSFDISYKRWHFHSSLKWQGNFLSYRDLDLCP